MASEPSCLPVIFVLTIINSILPFCVLQGQTWINNVRRCLIDAIRMEYESNANCEQLRENAFNSHPECYVSHGFCTDILFSYTNLLGLYNVLSTKLSVFFSRLSVNQVCIQYKRSVLHCITVAYFGEVYSNADV